MTITYQQRRLQKQAAITEQTTNPDMVPRMIRFLNTKRKLSFYSRVQFSAKSKSTVFNFPTKPRLCRNFSISGKFPLKLYGFICCVLALIITLLSVHVTGEDVYGDPSLSQGPGVTVVPVQGDQVKDLCDAQCAAMCITLGDEVCESICGKSGQRRSQTPQCSWLLKCQHSGCTGSCSKMPQTTPNGPVPETPLVNVSRDLTGNIIISWPIHTLEGNEKTVYLVSQATGYCSWAQLGWVMGNRYMVTNIPDLCTRPTFKVAAVSRFGSRWFSKEVETPEKIPARPRNLTFRLDSYVSHDDSEARFHLEWRPPKGWPPDRLKFDLMSEMDCPRHLDKVYIYRDESAVRIDVKIDHSPETVYVISGRIPLIAIGCKITFLVGAKPKCAQETFVKSTSVATTSFLFECTALNYTGRFCQAPPVETPDSAQGQGVYPSPVRNVTLMVMPVPGNKLLARVFWLPPERFGSGGYVEVYHLFWGLVDMSPSADLFLTFKDELAHTTVPGYQLTGELLLNISSFEPYETLGVVIIAAGPNQTVTPGFSNIHRSINSIAPSYDFSPDDIMANDSTVYVIQTHSGGSDGSKVKVDVFWRRPELFLGLERMNYQVTLKPEYIAATLEQKDDFQNMTSTRYFNTTREYLRIDDLQPGSNYSLIISKVSYSFLFEVQQSGQDSNESLNLDSGLPHNDYLAISSANGANGDVSDDATLYPAVATAMTDAVKESTKNPGYYSNNSSKDVLGYTLHTGGNYTDWLGAATGIEGIQEKLTHVVFTTKKGALPATEPVVVEGSDPPKRKDVHADWSVASLRWEILVACASVLGLLVVIGILWIKLRVMRRKDRRISIIGSAEYRPYSLLSLSTRNRQSQIRNIPVVADHWEIPLSSLKFGPALGQGAFGKVVLGRVSRAMLSHRGAAAFMADGGEESLKDGDTLHATVAIKMLQEGCDRKLCDDFLKEIRLMKRIGYHRNVVPMLACCTLRDPMCLLVQHLPRGDLHNFMRKCRTRRAQKSNYVNEADDAIKPMDLLRFALDITKGMAFLTSNGFVHRDLAARNVLISRDKTCKIGDFGLARYIYDDAVYVNRKGGRLPVKWMSVEAIFDQSFSSASDVWSFGVLLYELVTLGGVPYPTVHTRDLLRRLQAGYRMPRPDTCREITYMIMLECWKAEPSDRPTFTSLVEHLTGMLERGSDLVNDHTTSLGSCENGQNTDSLSQGSTDTDDGLLLVNEFNQDTMEQQDGSCTVIIRRPNENTSNSQVRFIAPRHTGLDRVTLGEEITAINPGAKTSQNMEAVSEDSGFEPSPKVSESGSEMLGESLKQTDQVFFGKFELEENAILEAAPSFHPLTMAYERQDLEILENDVFHVDAFRDTHLQNIEKLRELLIGTDDNVCHHKIREQFLFRARSISLIWTPKRNFEFEHVTPRSWQSCPNLESPFEGLLSIQREMFDQQDIIPTTSVATSLQNQRKLKKERRKAVVTPPTLALDNETYLAVGRPFQQLPPPIQITRRIKTRDYSDDFDFSRKSSAASSCPSRKESEVGFFPFAMHTQYGKSDGVFHRVLVQVHRPPSSPLMHGISKENPPSYQAAPSNIKQATTNNPLQDTPTSTTIAGKVVERGKRKFVRPQDISIQISNNIENEGIGNLKANKNFLNTTKVSSDIVRLSTTGVFPKQTAHINIFEDSSSSSRMSVSPVRYVHFRFPSVPPNSNYKRSLSENNILASVSFTEEFPLIPKTMRSLTLLNESSPNALPMGICTWSNAPSSVKSTKQAVNFASPGYIPVRRFSDPSSLPVSFIRQPSQASSPNSTTSSSRPESATESVISPGPSVTHFYIERGSPTGITNMHLRWPRVSLGRKKKVSWVEGYGVKEDISGDEGLEGETQHAGTRKTFVKEKHPFALYQV